MRKRSIAIIMFLIALLLPYQAAQAAEKEEVVLTSADGKAAVDIILPDTAEGITTLRLSIKITGETEKADSENPLFFEAAEGIGLTLAETRYRAEEGLFSIYLSDTSEITDKTSFRLGYLVPNSVDDIAYSLELSVLENGLSYVDATGVLRSDGVLPSPAVELRVNQAEELPEETPEEIPGETPEDMPENPEVESSDASGSAQNAETNKKNPSGPTLEKETAIEKKAVQTGDDTRLILCIVLLGGGAVGTAAVLRNRCRRRDGSKV